MSDPAKGLGEFFQTKLQSCLDGAEWGSRRQSNLALAHSSEERHLDGLPLKWGQYFELELEKFSHIREADVDLDPIVNPRFLLVNGRHLKTVFCSAIGLPSA